MLDKSYDLNILLQVIKTVIFSIQLLDHIIVAENGYLSMGKENEINRDYKNDDIKFIENTFVIEENTRLKKELNRLDSLTQMSPEINVVENYINWLLDLPWSYETVDTDNLNTVKNKILYVYNTKHFELQEQAMKEKFEKMNNIF